MSSVREVRKDHGKTQIEASQEKSERKSCSIGCKEGKHRWWEVRRDTIGDNEDGACGCHKKEAVVGDAMGLDCVQIMMVTKGEGEDALRCRK